MPTHARVHCSEALVRSAAAGAAPQVLTRALVLSGYGAFMVAWHPQCVCLKTIIHRSRVSCLIRIRCGLIFHLFFFLSTITLHFIHLTVMNTHLIHGQQDGLVAWPTLDVTGSLLVMPNMERVQFKPGERYSEAKALLKAPVGRDSTYRVTGARN